MKKQKGFTLIELIIVIGILAVLATVTFVVVNPPELLAQSRDAKRMSDLGQLNTAIELYKTSERGYANFSLGSSSVAYLSVPDLTATGTGNACTGLGMPSSSGYAYHCAANSTYLNNGGSTGWLPVAFSSIPSGVPFGTLAVDPVNQTSSNLYYTYETNGSQVAFSAFFESQKYAKTMNASGGVDPALYEVGTGITSLPVAGRGLAGYWPLNEGSGTSAIDWSGGNVTGTWQGTTSGIHGSGKVSQWAGSFNGSNNNIPVTITMNFNQAFTIAAWIDPTTSLSGAQGYFGNGGDQANSLYIGQAFTTNLICMKMTASGSTDYGGSDATVCNTSSLPVLLTPNQWQFVVFTFNPAGHGTRTSYLNGAVNGSYTPSSGAPNVTGTSFKIGSWRLPWAGLIADFRVYDRALSAAEIQEIYNAEK